MVTLREAAQQALEALELEATDPPLPETAAAMDALRSALAEPDPAPGYCKQCKQDNTGRKA